MEKIIESYLSYLQNEEAFSDETIFKYLANLKRIFNILKINKVEQLRETVINTRLLDEFWNEIQVGKILSESTRAGYLSALKSFLKFCFKIEIIKDNVAEKIIMPKARMIYLEGLTNDEQKRLRTYIAQNLKTERDLRNAALIMFLWGTAARVSEMLRLNCHPDNYIYFHDESIMSGDFFNEDGRIYVHIRGKGKRDRKIIVPNDVLSYLNLYLHERKKKNEILFHNYHNRYSNNLRLTRMGAVNIVREIFEKCEINHQKGLITHALRHTAINTWIEKSITDQQIITMTGHSSPEGLNLYHNRNKHLTDIFGDKAQSIININEPKLKKMEELIKKRHSLQ